MKRIAVFAVAALLLSSGAVAAQGLDLDQMSEQERLDELYAMSWQPGPGSFELPLSHSRIELTEGQEIVVGDTAARYDYLTNGIRSPQTEAVVWNAADDSLTFFTFHDVGYVTEEDWEHVDAEDFLAQMKEAEAEENAERERLGLTPFWLAGWRQEPTFDPAQHTAFWAADLSNPDAKWINATALRLSRDGYHQIIWAGSGEGFVGAQSTLAGLLGSHTYDGGHRYEDYVEGDNLADLSIGALAAAALGVKFGKGLLAALIAIGLVFLKKGWIVILLAGGAIAAFFRKLRAKRAAAATSATGATNEPPPPAIG
jgi:uncharacterized membrane-anchored protein